MAKLLSVRGPHARSTNNSLRVQWNMGNPCNYQCDYCPPILHDGSKPWFNTEVYIDTIKRLNTHYKTLNKVLDYELIGGEVTVIPGFEDIVRTIREGGSRSLVFTNGGRTINWWSKAKYYLDSIVYTYHPLSQDEEHFKAVLNEIKDFVHVDINIAGIGGAVDELGVLTEEIRDLFKDCNRNRYDSVSICVKTMYKKLLGARSKQETYWEYTDSELEVLKRPGIKPRPAPPTPPGPPEPLDVNAPQHTPPDPKTYMTEFLYDNGTAKYVQNHQIINEGLNQFYGMKCHLGFESLNIDASGDMYSSWCGAMNFGNISDIDWNLPEVEFVCPMTNCNNLSDISITKTAVDTI